MEIDTFEDENILRTSHLECFQNIALQTGRGIWKEDHKIESVGDLILDLAQVMRWSPV